MDIEQGKQYAVVSGDLVASSKIRPDLRQNLHRIVEDASRDMREFFGAGQIMGIDLYAGDSWQFLVENPANSLRAVLFLRAYLRAHVEGADTRCAVGLGTIRFIPRDRVSEGDGEAFQRSGRLLQAMKKGPAMRFESGDPQITKRWDLVLGLLDAVVRSSWTRRRSLAVTGEIRGWTQKKTAELWQKFGIRSKELKQGTVSGYLDQAHWKAVSRALREFEQEHNIAQ